MKVGVKEEGEKEVGVKVEEEKEVGVKVELQPCISFVSVV